MPKSDELQEAREARDLALLQLETKRLEATSHLLEATDTLWNKYVDPRQAYLDDHGAEWLPLGSQHGLQQKEAINSEQALAHARAQGRRLGMLNEFAINGYTNRVSYIVGTGLQYKVVAVEGVEVADETVAAVQEYIDRFLDENDYDEFEQEMVYRCDRDGECFIRRFVDVEGIPQLRWIEPEDVHQPQGEPKPYETWGILTDPTDTQTVLAYYVIDEWVPAEEILHIKLNVVKNVKRGLPTFYPVRKNFNRAEKLLRNMSMVAGIQAAIAMVREHDGFSKGSVQAFADDEADFTIQNEVTAKSQRYQKIGPAEIIDAPKGIKYHFPATGVNAGNFVVVLQADLRAIASRLVMPEFMLTSDASNANYSSTMVAEGPAHKNFKRLQSFFMKRSRGMVWQAIDDAVAFGILDPVALTLDLEVTGPEISIREPKVEAETFEIMIRNKVVSRQTAAEKQGLDWEQELMRMEEEAESMITEPLDPNDAQGNGEGDDDSGDE